MVASILNEICDQRRKDVVVAKEQVGPARVPAPRAAPRACGGACWGGPPASAQTRASSCGAPSAPAGRMCAGQRAVHAGSTHAARPRWVVWVCVRAARRISPGAPRAWVGDALLACPAAACGGAPGAWRPRVGVVGAVARRRRPALACTPARWDLCVPRAAAPCGA